MPIKNDRSRRPSVGVVIPYYNREHTLHRALASVLRQTYRDYNVIIVDDGSREPHRLEEIVTSCGDARIRTIRLAENQGGAAARNVGVRASDDDFIAFLDSDDEWMPTKLERQVEAYHSHNDPMRIVYCQSDVRTSDNQAPFVKIWPKNAIGESESVGDYLFCNRGYLPTPSLFLRRDLAVRFPFNESLSRHQDYDLILRLEAGGALFEMVREPLVVVHWEDVGNFPRMLNPSFSLRFASDYQQYLSSRARSRFILQQVIMPLLKAGDRHGAARHVALTALRLRDMAPLDFLTAFSLLIFRDNRVVQCSLRLRSKLCKIAASFRRESAC